MRIFQIRFMMIVLRFIVGKGCHPDIKSDAKKLTQEIHNYITAYK